MGRWVNDPKLSLLSFSKAVLSINWPWHVFTHFRKSSKRFAGTKLADWPKRCVNISQLSDAFPHFAFRREVCLRFEAPRLPAIS